MPKYEGLVTIKLGGKYHPPGTIHEFDEVEAKALGPGVVRLAKTDTAVAAVAPSAGVAAPGDAPPADSAIPPAAAEAGGASDRVSEIKAALDLLNPDDFVQSGKRAGKPKIKPLSEVLGFDPTDEEIDAAMALRDEGV